MCRSFDHLRNETLHFLLSLRKREGLLYARRGEQPPCEFFVDNADFLKRGGFRLLFLQK